MTAKASKPTTRKSISFTAEIADRGPTGAWCHLFFPPEASAFLGKRGQVPIALSVKGVEFPSTARPDGKGGHFILFNSEMREKTGTKAGDAVAVVLRVDTAPRVVTVPSDLKKAFAGAQEARAAFEAMPYSHQKAYLEYIDEAKTAGTRAKRLTQSLGMIKAWGEQREAKKRKKSR